VSAVLAGLAGALLAPVYSLSPTVGWMPFTYAFLVVVVGGLGNISGVIVTAFLMGLIKNIFSIWISPAWVLPIIFGIMILILLARPRGLFGTRE
jgi:branched-chain amino acid transport system permease protein